MARLSISRLLVLDAHRLGVPIVALPYCCTSRRPKLPSVDSPQTLVLWPLEVVFKHASPALNPEYRAKGWMEPKPTPTIRAVADRVVPSDATLSTLPNMVG